MMRMSAIKSEHKLVEIRLKMGSPQPMINALGPRFEVGKSDVDPGQDDVGGHGADDMRIVNYRRRPG